MKTAIYTISLDEEKHAEAFMKSCDGADYIVVGDTGSTDRTSEIVQDYGGTVISLNVRPWRFDVARNAVLTLLPLDIDVCIGLDLDERLCSNWRELVNENWRPKIHDRLAFRYVHDYKPDGSYGTVGLKNFAHSRENYVWRHIVHEELYYTGDRDTENTLTLTDMVIEHRQDLGKSRDSYLRMLEWECQQLDTTPRHLFWLAREYVYKENWEKVIHWCDEYLAHQNRWHVEAAHAYRFKAKALSHLGRPVEALTAHYAAIQEAPGEREVWLDLGWFHASRHEWEQVYGAAVQAISITHRPEHYLAGPEAWGHKVYELAAQAAHILGIKEKAQDHIRTAKRLAPDMEHINQLLRIYGLS